MRTTRAIGADRKAVSPVIATILMVAITVVLAAVLYVMVSGLVSGPNTAPDPVIMRVTRTGDGSNWKLNVDEAPGTGLNIATTQVVVISDAGAVLLSATPLSQLSGNASYEDVDGSGDFTAGDYVLLSTTTYPVGSEFQLLGPDGTLAIGNLQ
ncbi:MAG: archaellin/type IV pilin N-terminal domain-containing protein [Thermoplasmata archaeon]